MAEQQAPAQRAWMFRVGKKGEYEDRFIETGGVGLGWHQLPDLKEFTAKEYLRQDIAAAVTEFTSNQVGGYAGQLWRLRTEASAGDLVVLKHKTAPPLITLGVVTSGYRYQADVDEECDCHHVVQAEWKCSDVPLVDVQDDLRASLGGRRSVYEIGGDDAVWRLGRIMETGSDYGAR